MLTHDLKHFALNEFKHPELVNEKAAEFLDELREQFGQPLTLTDDARLPTDLPTGTPGPGKSLHYVGQAFDLRIHDFDDLTLWKLVNAAINVGNWVARGNFGGMELELVWSSTDKHMHVGFFLDGRANRLSIRTE